MKARTHKNMALLALATLLATPPSVIHSTSKMNRSIASLLVEEPKIEEKLEVKLPDLTEIKVAEPEVKEAEKKEVKPLVSITELEKFELKHEKIDIKLPELKALDIKMSHPRFDKLVQIATEKKNARDLEISAKTLRLKQAALKEKLSKLKDSKDEDKIDSAIIDLLLVESSLKKLKEKKAITPKENDETEKFLTEAKDKLELLMLDGEEVVKAKEEKEEKKVEAKVAEASEKKEVKEEKEDKSEKKEKAEVACEKDEKIGALTKQVEQLVADQNKIMQNMLSMTQMMMMNSMMQQQQQMQQQMQSSIPYQYPNAYQYAQPQTAGNWVYYPQGFQPGQSNIFSQPQLTQYQGGFYPDQTHQSSWGLQPSMNFNTSSMVTPGTFGSGNGISFNMSNPLVTQR